MQEWHRAIQEVDDEKDWGLAIEVESEIEIKMDAK